MRGARAGGPAPGVATGGRVDLSTMSKTEVKRAGLKIGTFSEHVKRGAYNAAATRFAAWPISGPVSPPGGLEVFEK